MRCNHTYIVLLHKFIFNISYIQYYDGILEKQTDSFFNKNVHNLTRITHFKRLRIEETLQRI
jgi:hypothetical protein